MSVPTPIDRDRHQRGCNFLGLTEDEADYKSARLVIVPVAYDATTSYKSGARYGPGAIIAASREVETFNPESQRELATAGIATWPEVEAEADGPAQMVATVEHVIAEQIAAGKYCAMLGGEHSITEGAVRAHQRKWRDLTVLQIDAHADMRDAYQGSKHSHASVMRRVREICPAVSVGVRSTSEECRDWTERGSAWLTTSGSLPVYWAIDIVGRNDWHDAAIADLSEHVYITFDLDALDPSIMPAVGTPEPGGMGWYETIDFLRKVFAQRHVVGFDVVELCPIPGLHHADFTAARLTAAMVGMAVPKL
jgi:agmatinase